MANLATMIMKGTAVYGTSKLSRKYDHVDGPALIAMESAEALRDIFETAFYENNACSLRAVAEGYTDFDSSPYAATMEGIIADAFQKIKDFLIKLKDKVIAFFHNVIRYLSGIFMDGKKWVTKYDKELNAIRNKLKDYEVEMYDYEDLDKAPESAIDGFGKVEEVTEELINEIGGNMVNDDSTRNDDRIDKAFGKFVREELKIKDFADDDDLSKACWEYFRKGASSENDKEKKEVSSIFSNAIKALKESDKQVSKLNKAINAADNMYKKVIKAIDKLASKADSDANKQEDENLKKDRSKFAEKARTLSSFVSRIQTAENTYFNAWKSALVERNKAYQSALVGAFAYARKNKD